MEIIIFILGLFVAFNYTILSYGLGVVDNTDQLSMVDYGICLIIVLSALPMAIKFSIFYYLSLVPEGT